MKRNYVFKISIRNLIRWLGMGTFACLMVSIQSCGQQRNGYNSGYLPNPYNTNINNQFPNNFNRFNTNSVLPGTFNQQAQNGNLGCVAQYSSTYGNFEQSCSACNGTILPAKNSGLKEDVCRYNIFNQTVNTGKLINLTPRGWGFPPQRMSIFIQSRPFATVEVVADYNIRQAGKEKFYIYLQDPTGLSTSNMITAGNLTNLDLSMMTPSSAAYLVIEAQSNISVDGRASVVGCELASGQFVKCPSGSGRSSGGPAI